MNEDVVLICRAEDRGAAEALAALYPGGAGTFSIQLTASTAVDLSVPTFYAGSGQMDSAMVAACRLSVSPMITVLANDGTPFDQLVGTCKLYGTPTNPATLRKCSSTISVSRRQAELAMYYDGVLDIVQAVVAAAPMDVQISYNRASEFKRDDPMLNSVCLNVLKWTDKQIDDLFTLALSIRA